MKPWPIRWDLLLRYRLIEIIAQWEGRVTSRHLQEAFGICRQQASKDINRYLALTDKVNLVYDKYLKGYKPTSEFTPQFTQGVVDEYLLLAHHHQHLNTAFEWFSLPPTATQIIAAPLRNIKPPIARALVQATANSQRVSISYASLSSDTVSDRIISPHSLVFSGVRWHARAYCENKETYLDFVLSRIRGMPKIVGQSSHNKQEDTAWNNHMTLIIKPDTRLKRHQQAIIADDFGMQDGKLTITTRAALVQYTLLQLQIDPKILQGQPIKQQIVIDNLSEITEHLF